MRRKSKRRLTGKYFKKARITAARTSRIFRKKRRYG